MMEIAGSVQVASWSGPYRRDVACNVLPTEAHVLVDKETLQATSLRQLRREHQYQHPDDDAVHGKRRKSAFADVGHEPGDRGIGDDERDYKSDREHDPAMCVDLRDADWILAF